MSETYAIGDVVQLLSGGESMTIEHIDGEEVGCVWFEGKRVQRASFMAATLKRYVHPSLSGAVTRG